LGEAKIHGACLRILYGAVAACSWRRPTRSGPGKGRPMRRRLNVALRRPASVRPAHLSAAIAARLSRTRQSPPAHTERRHASPIRPADYWFRDTFAFAGRRPDSRRCAARRRRDSRGSKTSGRYSSTRSSSRSMRRASQRSPYTPRAGGGSVNSGNSLAKLLRASAWPTVVPSGTSSVCCHRRVGAAKARCILNSAPIDGMGALCEGIDEAGGDPVEDRTDHGRKRAAGKGVFHGVEHLATVVSQGLKGPMPGQAGKRPVHQMEDDLVRIFVVVARGETLANAGEMDLHRGLHALLVAP